MTKMNINVFEHRRHSQAPASLLLTATLLARSPLSAPL